MQIYFSSYALGAGVATGLINTAPRVRRIAGEVLAEPSDLAQFLTEHGLRQADMLADEGVVTEKDLAQVRALRQELREILEADVDDQVVAGATSLVARERLVPTLVRDGDHGWHWGFTTSSPVSVPVELAVLTGMGLLGALRALGHDRFRHCASPDCDGMFVDTSKAGRRRYCMPDLCGNRLNVAKHRARQRHGAESPST